MKRILIALALVCGAMSTQAQSTNLIPAPAEYKVGKGFAKLSNCKIVKSEKVLLHRLEGKDTVVLHSIHSHEGLICVHNYIYDFPEKICQSATEASY